ERLGLAPLLEARGALRTQAEFWTPYGGWFGFPPGTPDGWGATRRTLDPLLPELATATPGADLPAGHDAVSLLTADDRPVGGAHRWRLPELRADREGGYARMLAGLPDAPDLSQAERVSKLIGKLEMPNVMRPGARRGVAFVGDAAVASDPLAGVGCGFAFQSA